MTTTHSTPHGARAQFDDAFANLVRAWLVADTLRAEKAPFGQRSEAAADLMRARSSARRARLHLDAA